MVSVVVTSVVKSKMSSKSLVIHYPETTFVAVSAYHNKAITKLKIDNNPYAKAYKFRLNDPSNIERNNTSTTMKEEIDQIKKQTLFEGDSKLIMIVFYE